MVTLACLATWVAAPLVQADYTAYNGAAHLTQTSVQLLGQSFGMAFEYGDDRRLTSATTGQVHGDQQVNLTYTLGPGQRLQSDGEYAYTYDAAGRLTTRASATSTIGPRLANSQ